MSRGSTRGRLSQHFGQTARRHRLASANLEHRPRAPCTACRLAISYPRWASFPGPAAGLSGPVIARLTETWTAEQRAFAERDLSGDGLCLLGPGALGSDAELGAGLGPQSGAVAGTVVICGPLTRSSRPSPQSGTGPRSPRARVAAGLAMAFKLIESAQDRWRAVSAPTLSPWSAPERPSTAASSSNDPHRRPSPKLPNDLDPHVLAIVPA